MNSLSWYLYLADVSSSLKGFSWFMVVVATLLGILGFAAAGIYAVTAESSRYKNREADAENEEALSKAFLKVGWRAVPLFTLFFMSASFIPSSQTLMLIAASQFGEVALANAKVQEMGGEVGDLATDSLRLLKQYVEKQLETAPEPKERD